jgi:hypothetical protein
MPIGPLEGVVSRREAAFGILALYVALLVGELVTGSPLIALAADVLVTVVLLAAGVGFLVVVGHVRWPLTAAAVMLVVGGVAGGYDAFAQAGYAVRRPLVVTISNVALLSAFALYLYDIYG